MIVIYLYALTVRSW